MLSSKNSSKVLAIHIGPVFLIASNWASNHINETRRSVVFA